MRHPVPARLKAYAFHQIDFDREVEFHLMSCKACEDLIAEELLAQKNEEALSRRAAGEGPARGATRSR
jgi:hypothetical protein